MSWHGMLIGHAAEGSAASAARVSLMFGHRDGPVGAAWAHALAAATPPESVSPFLALVRNGVALRPATMVVPEAGAGTREHAELIWGAVHAGISGGIRDALQSGVLPVDIAEDAVMVVKAWVDPVATLAHQDVVCLNNRAATLAALGNARHDLPSIAEIAEYSGPVGNAFYTP